MFWDDGNVGQAAFHYHLIPRGMRIRGAGSGGAGGAHSHLTPARLKKAESQYSQILWGESPAEEAHSPKWLDGKNLTFW